ncbi:MAG: 1-deoxy-D-xylulose-5-phosphate synthase [Bacillota bacterium]
MMDINTIKDPSFLNDLSIKDCITLSNDIRTFLIENISKTGGHLASNLGVVELTIAMHKVFDSPRDHLLFDVGHQGYVHKILTGRAKAFPTLRQIDGLSGFLKRSESIHDVFEAGHSSTSLAAGAGFLLAKKHNPDIGHVVMLIGDGAIASGMGLEALNFMGHDKTKHPIIILNDNEMSISKNIGHLSKILTKFRMKRSLRSIRRSASKLMPKFIRPSALKVEKRVKGFISGHTYFEDLGYQYYGPIDGHNFKSLLNAFTIAKQEKQPCIIHVRTQKGKGYTFSEQDQKGTWHGVKPFKVETGNFLKSQTEHTISYSKAVATFLHEETLRNPALHVITPAMVGGSELYDYQLAHPDNLIDVGIAEQTAVTMAAGLALKNVSVFVSIYSTFIQRAYDQVIHDVARHQVPVVFGIDRAGLVGGDGETHQGIYDIPLLAHIPNMIIAHPKNTKELYGIMRYAFDQRKTPIAIRYEKIKVTLEDTQVNPIRPSWDIITQGDKLTLITFGSVIASLKSLIKDNNLPITLINARFIKPLDNKILDKIDKSIPLLTVEESTLNGGLGSMIINYLAEHSTLPTRVKRLGFDEAFVPQGNRTTMLKRYNLDPKSIIAIAEAMINET